MQNFDLNAYGVSEMTAQEMLEVDGGLWLTIGVISILAVYLVAETMSYAVNGDNSMQPKQPKQPKQPAVDTITGPAFPVR